MIVSKTDIKGRLTHLNDQFIAASGFIEQELIGQPHNIVQVNHGAAETGSASSQVLSSAQSLSAESNRLKLEVGKSLATVRAA